MENKKFELCYIDGNKAYFTSDWEHQWGDDWNDSPYEHNAGSPYDSWTEIIDDKSDSIETSSRKVRRHKIELKTLYYEFPNEWVKLPCDNYTNSPYSVDTINRGEVAWIVGEKFVIPAKTTFEDFIKIVEENNGVVYLKKNRLNFDKN